MAAPAENQSGVGHGITFGAAHPREADRAPGQGRRPARGRGTGSRPGPRPVCASRLPSLLKDKPDVVVSGINRGDNAGLTLYVSGTLGAAREAAFDGMPAVAASLVMPAEMDYGPGAAVLGTDRRRDPEAWPARGARSSRSTSRTEITGVKVVQALGERRGQHLRAAARAPTRTPTSGTSGRSPRTPIPTPTWGRSAQATSR